MFGLFSLLPIFMMGTANLELFSCNVEIYRSQEKEEKLDFGNFESYPEHKVSSSVHVLSTMSDSNTGLCILTCINHRECLSFNSKKQSDGKVSCELLKTDRYTSHEALTSDSESTHYSIMSPCTLSPCNHGKCFPEYNTGGYTCTCDPGYFGTLCNKGLYKSCQEILTNNPGTPTGTQTLLDAETQTTFEIYCRMESITGCGAGPWMLALKIKGNLNNYRFGSSRWFNKVAYNEGGGKILSDHSEAKMRTYWTSTASSLCVGMKSGSVTNWMKVPLSDPKSLYDNIADGVYRGTSVAKGTWKGLINSYLQSNCNRQGFNALGRIRFGYKANNENDCNTCDTWIGFGEIGHSCGDSGNTNVNCYILIK